MKASILLHLAAASHAFLLPQQDVLTDIQVETERAADRLPCKQQIWDDIESTASSISESAESAFDNFAHKAHDVFDYAWTSSSNVGDKLKEKTSAAYESADEWLADVHDRFDESSSLGLDVADLEAVDGHRPPHHKPSHDKKPHLTVYELIAKSKYTTKLAKLINEYPDLVSALNGTKANYTIFAPTDRAFEKIPDHAKKPSKELLLKVLLYHVSSDFYPAGRILGSRTIPTLLKSDELGRKPQPQRLATEISFRGLTVNFYSRVVAPNIFGTNGVIHGIDSIIIPPPEILQIVDLLPSPFSTLELGLLKTGLLEDLNSTKHEGATFFAPSNWAFAKLGSRANAFLFSKEGQKYLKALLQYHVVPERTLYSDAYYKGSSRKAMFDEAEPEHHSSTRGFFHVELPTLLKDRSLAIDVARYGRLIEIKINGFSRVAVSDIVARDGVIHELSSVLIPPRKLGNGESEEWDGESEMSEEELMDRLDGWVDEEL